MSLQIIKAKPDPAGKDKTSAGISKPEQLLGEWVDIKNIGNEAIRFSTIKLHHKLFNNNCQPIGRMEIYWSGNGNDLLKPGQTLRVHTGNKQHENLMSSEDRGNPDWRGFAGKGNFVLNNQCGDTISVTWQDSQGRQYEDHASYDPNPPEGAVLERSGDKLVLMAVRTRY